MAPEQVYEENRGSYEYKRQKPKKRLTPKQKRFMHEVIVNKKSLTDAADAVYDCNSRESARTTGSVTYKAIESLVDEEYKKLGMSKEFVMKSLVEDIMAKPGNRSRELTLAANLLGMNREKKTVEHTGKMGIEALLGEIDATKRLSE